MNRMCIVFCAAMWAVPLAAHSLYLIPQKFAPAVGETIVVSVHNGDSFPAGSEAPDPSRLIDARLALAGEVTAIEDFRALGNATHGAVRIGRAGSGWLAVRTSPRMLHLDAERFERYLRKEGLQEVLEWRSRHGEAHRPGRERYGKYAKSLIVAGAPDGAFAGVLGLDIEFVLDLDPASVELGGMLPVRLLWHGKPAAGVQVEYAWAGRSGRGTAIAGRTDGEGRVRIPLTHRGKWRLHAVAMERAAGTELADWESYWASLTFEFGGRPQPKPNATADDSAVR